MPTPAFGYQVLLPLDADEAPYRLSGEELT